MVSLRLNQSFDHVKQREITEASISNKYYSFDDAYTLATSSTISFSESEDYDCKHEFSPRSRRDNYSRRFKQKNSPRNGNKYGMSYKYAKSTKPHDAPMRRADIYFSLDCEMVGVGPDGLDSALARVSIVNWDNKIILDTYVKVDQPVTDYRTFVSGIRPEQIESDSALPLSEVRRLVTSTLQGKILIGHGLSNDLKVIGINHPWCDIRDTATYKPFMKVQESRTSDDQALLRPRKLKDLVLEKLGKEIQIFGKAHSPVEDAIAAMDLYKAVRSEWELDMMKQVKKANHAENERNRLLNSFGSMSISGISSVPLSPNYQYAPMNFQRMPMSPYGNTQPSYRVSGEQARLNTTVASHNQIMMLRHC